MAALQHVGAAAPGLAAPERLPNDKAPGVVAEGFEGNGTADSLDSAARAAIAEADKTIATLRAQLAMRAFELHVISDGAGGSMYLVQRWCQSRTLATIDDVRAFARQVGATT